MTLLEEIKLTIDVLKQKRKFKTQKDVAIYLGYNPSYFSRLMGGKEEIPMDFENKFFTAFPKSVYLYGKDDMFSDYNEPPPPTDKKADALDQLKKVTNGKNIEKKDNHIFHTFEAYVLPVKGRLGLGSTYYADSYFEDKLEKTTVSVTEKPTNANRIILAEFEGESMTDGSPEQIPDGSWVVLAERKRGEDWDANMEGKIMGFFDKDDNFTIKKVKKHDKHFKYVILEALNPDKTQPENQDRELEIKNCWAIYDYVSKLS